MTTIDNAHAAIMLVSGPQPPLHAPQEQVQLRWQLPALPGWSQPLSLSPALRMLPLFRRHPIGLGHRPGQPLSRPHSSGCRGVTASQGTLCPPRLSDAQAAGTEGASAWVFGHAVSGGMPLHMGCTTTARVSGTISRQQGCALAGPRRAMLQACLASPVPGYRQLSRQHTPTHRKHLAQKWCASLPQHIALQGWAPGGGCGMTAAAPGGPKGVPLPHAWCLLLFWGSPRTLGTRERRGGARGGVGNWVWGW